MSASETANHTASQRWTTERVDLLKTYVNAGLSCGQIACEIGVTRNAVIGKINRLGLSARRPQVVTPRRALRAVYREGPCPAEEEPVASIEPCSLLELAQDKCRWPISASDAEDIVFCGNRSVPRLSYCAAHARLAYRPPARRDARSA